MRGWFWLTDWLWNYSIWDLNWSCSPKIWDCFVYQFCSYATSVWINVKYFNFWRHLYRKSCIYCTSSEAVVPRKKLQMMFRQWRERTSVGNPSSCGITVNPCSSCGFFWAKQTLSSLFTTFHCSLLKNAELWHFCVCNLHDFEGFSIIKLRQYRRQNTAVCMWSGSPCLSLRLTRITRVFTCLN